MPFPRNVFMKIDLIDLSDWPYPDIALGYLAGALDRTGHQVSVTDTFFGTGGHVRKDGGSRTERSITGFSVMTHGLERALNAAGAAKRRNPSTRILFGGIHPTLFPEETLAHPTVDAVCIGEGEETIVEYADALEKGTQPEIPGVWYKSGGSVIKNPLRPFKEELDQIPFPAWRFWDMDKYLRLGVMIPDTLFVFGSRGCPLGCSFCSQEALREKTRTGKVRPYYRLRSAENIISEILLYKGAYGGRMKSVYFFDCAFGLDREQFRTFTDLYVKKGLNRTIPWACQTLANRIDAEWSERAKDAGCFYVGMGMETSDENMRLSIYNKPVKDTAYRQAAKLLKEKQIVFSLNLIIGSPGEDRAFISRNIEEAERYEPLLTYITPYMPLPGTGLFRSHGQDIVIKTDLLGGIPRIQTERLGIRELSRIVWGIRIRQILKKILICMRLRGPGFLSYLIGYVLDFRGMRTLRIGHAYILIHMLDRKIFEHFRDLVIKRGLMEKPLTRQNSHV